jgi:hypothetical protein
MSANPKIRERRTRTGRASRSNPICMVAITWQSRQSFRIHNAWFGDK